MSFAAPWALAGLLLAGIPILLHLLARREPPTVPFPATRYLADAAKLHQRRLKLQHLLLLLLRTLVVAALVFAAAGPSLPTAGLGSHAPTALVVVVDNSLSSGVIEAGEPALTALKAAARAVVERATSEDRLWLLAADRIPWPEDRAGLLRRIDSLLPSPRRLDLGEALTLGADVLATADRPGEMVVISDLQRSALSATPAPVPTVVLRPEGDPVTNGGIGDLNAGSQPWGTEGGNVVVTMVGDGNRARPVTIGSGGAAARPPKQLLVRPGGQVSTRLTAIPPGWTVVEATLDPDELRADDRWAVAVRVSPPARVAWRPNDRFLATAAEVLVQNGRIVAGGEVALGWVGGGASVVIPPADPAELGAVNRALAAVGSRWRFGDLDLTPAATDSGAWLGRERVLRRHRLVFEGGAPSDVLVTIGGDPWAVRSGRAVLVGSRFEPEWTALPLSAGFLPFLDALVNRASRGELATLTTAPGDPVRLPDRITAVVAGAERWTVEGGAPFRPPRPGVFYLLAERDTVGALSVNSDPRESDLSRASSGEVSSLWPRARLAALEDAAAMAFRAGARSDLRGPFLWLAVLAALGEVLVASVRRQRA
jgi:hypothetical protein